MTMSVDYSAVSCLWGTPPNPDLIGCEDENTNWTATVPAPNTYALKGHVTTPTESQQNYDLGITLDQLTVSAAPYQNIAGGSSFAWYGLTQRSGDFCEQTDPPDPNRTCMCSGKRHGVLATHDAASFPYNFKAGDHVPDPSSNPTPTNVREAVRAHLQDMRDAGQQKIRIPVLHKNDVGPNQQVFLYSDCNGLNQKGITNLENLVEDVMTTGFESMVVAMYPQGQNTPKKWTSWCEVDGGACDSMCAYDEDANPPDFPTSNDYYLSNQAVIIDVHQAVTDKINDIQKDNPGQYDTFSVKFVLRNAGIPTQLPDTHSINRKYSQLMWSWYVSAYGKNDTLGFSIAMADPDRVELIQSLDEVYGTDPAGYPDTIETNVYTTREGRCDPGEPCTVTEKLVFLDQVLAEKSFTGDLVISESVYNDGNIALEIANSNVNIKELYQWPISANDQCTKTSDVAVPVNSVY